MKKVPWPIPLPDWWWGWAEWYLGRGAYKELKRDPRFRPLNAPAKIPWWAWARLAAFLGQPIPAEPKPPPPPAPTEDPDLRRARAMLSDARRFTGHYFFGGGHGRKASTIEYADNLDCSSSTSALLEHFDLLESEWVQVSGWFRSWAIPGYGRYVTVHANGEHVWIEFDLPEGYFRFDTSPHGDGPSGPRVRTVRRFDSTFSHRHHTL